MLVAATIGADLYFSTGDEGAHFLNFSRAHNPVRARALDFPYCLARSSSSCRVSFTLFLAWRASCSRVFVCGDNQQFSSARSCGEFSSASGDTQIQNGGAVLYFPISQLLCWVWLMVTVCVIFIFPQTQFVVVASSVDGLPTATRRKALDQIQIRPSFIGIHTWREREGRQIWSPVAAKDCDRLMMMGV